MFEEFFDIVVLAIISGFIIFKLYNILGQHDDDNLAKKSRKNVVNLKIVNPEPAVINHEVAPQMQSHLPSYVTSVITRINNKDIDFSEEFFLKGAKLAFKIIFQAYEDNDESTLRSLLVGKVYQELVGNLDQSRKNEQRTSRKLNNIVSCEIIDARLSDSTANIKVKFVSEQISNIVDINNISGSNEVLETLEDIWEFERDLNSKNPKWYLSEINC